MGGKNQKILSSLTLQAEEAAKKKIRTDNNKRWQQKIRGNKKHFALTS